MSSKAPAPAARPAADLHVPGWARRKARRHRPPQRLESAQVSFVP